MKILLTTSFTKKHATICLQVLIIIFCCANYACSSQASTPPNGVESPYDPTWESLSKHNEAPEWLQDAKLGIYFQNVPARRKGLPTS